MRLKISEVNFTSKFDWLFKLIDEKENNYYIMNELFYKVHNYKSPITKNELDYYDKGLWITALVKEIDQKKIVIEIL